MELRAAVEALLAAVDGGGPLASGCSDLSALGDDLLRSHAEGQAMPAGARIGAFRIVDEIGRGGMAVVYRAERVDGAYEQRVAIKLLKRGTDTEEILARFVQERQILASLGHPAIARLLDGGVTDDGRPYLAMELVEGESIDRYCADLDLEGRLRLFVDVCRAVEHAHRQLVVHRDLKPSNVLVTTSGQVKLLDFGIAKLLVPRQGRAVPPTRTQLRLLTPEYASPEQVRGEPVTIATDVYQLGLLLYELLTGRRPFRIAGRTPSEVERAICHQAPLVPSAAVTRAPEPETSVGTTPADANPRRLARQLKGDLDNVVLLALRKEAERRYVSVGALARDVELFLEGRPISARRAGLAYRARKLAHRHVWTLGATSASVLLLAGLLLFHSLRLVRERDQARWEAQEAYEVIGLLSSGPAVVEYPRSHQQHLAELLLELGRPREALPHVEHRLETLEKKVGSGHRRLLSPLLLHAEVLLELGDPEGARRAFERSRSLLGGAALSARDRRRLAELAARLEPSEPPLPELRAPGGAAGADSTPPRDPAGRWR